MAEAKRAQQPDNGSPVEEFIALVSTEHGTDFVASWLLPSHFITMPDGSPAFQTCEFSWDEIFAPGAVVDRLRDRCFAQLKQAGVRLIVDPNISARFQAWGRNLRTKGKVAPLPIKVAKPLSPLKTETAQRFAEKVRAADRRIADLYLDHDAMYRDNEIVVSPIGVVKLQPFDALAKAMGLTIRERTFEERGA